MNQNRLVVGLIVALVIGLVAARYVYLQLRSARLAAMRLVPTGQIVVAAMPLQLGERLTPSDLREIPWPEVAKPAGAFARIDDCLDRAVITPVVENEPILEEKLAPKGVGGGLSVAIPEGMRAISVHVDEVVAVAGFVVPGKIVDILVSARTTNGDVFTRIMLEHVRVLAVGQRTGQDREGKPQIYTVVTLLVTPEDAEKLTMATLEGRIQLVLRNTIDTKEANPAPVYRASLLAGGSPPAPAEPKIRRASPPPAPRAADVYVIDVIRGEKRESQSFPAPSTGGVK